MTNAPAIPSPAKTLGDLLIRIVLILANRVSWSTLSPVLVHQISKRLWRIKHRIDRIADLVRDGKYIPRTRATPLQPAAPGTRKPPQSLPEMRKFNWLAQILPDVPPLRGAFLDQLQRPEMAALIAAAPGAMIPPLRSLCWTLGLRPPPILARPKRPKLSAALPAPEPSSPEVKPLRTEGPVPDRWQAERRHTVRLRKRPRPRPTPHPA